MFITAAILSLLPQEALYKIQGTKKDPVQLFKELIFLAVFYWAW